MKAEKVVVKIEMEALDIEVLPGMINSVIEQVTSGAESGVLSMSDGDCIKWKTKRKSVKF